MPIHVITRRIRLFIVGAVFVWSIPAAGAQAGSLSIAWDPSPDADVTNYVVSYGTQSGVYTDSLNVGNQTVWTFTALADGQVYYLVVQAQNAAGLGAYSSEVNGVASSSAPLPCAFSVSPLVASVTDGSSAGTVTVTTGAGCSWTATSNASWLTGSRHGMA